MKQVKFILGLGFLLLSGCGNNEYDISTKVADVQDDIHKEYYNKTYSSNVTFYTKMQKIIDENIRSGNTIIEASEDNVAKIKIDPIQFKECVFYEIWTIKNPQNISYDIPAERCQTTFVLNDNIESLKYSDPSYVMGNFKNLQNAENILAENVIKKELAKPLHATDVKSYRFINGKYQILDNGKYIYIIQTFSAKSSTLGNYTKNAHIVLTNKGEIVKVKLNQDKDFNLDYINWNSI
ncbi:MULTISPECIES: hypothetical protein [Campylobacter]|uniref:hypothetical protein n=1 Tax=Campylobacter TaxID=194 RepID=UPI0021F6CD6B|nr:hypothetical protein [Campylobacter lari]MCW0254182.1 hypothetical protein [Campylobacter lari]